ncbi:MAG: hypothetical protein ABIK09_13455 [Pseudomonadota bacterium]
MIETLTGRELAALVRRVFQPGPGDRILAIIVDLPDVRVPDEDTWARRRALALEWYRALLPEAGGLGMEVRLYLYRNAHANNADLPTDAWRYEDGPLPETAEAWEGRPTESFEALFGGGTILIAPTHFSATAPLKLAARAHPFRAATMPGFTEAMIPALRLDYVEINLRCQRLKGLLDRAVAADLEFLLDGTGTHRLHLDLRHRTATASGGSFPNNGVAGNLPSGETYIVPYEGEIAGSPTGSEGTLPVQFGGEVVVYTIAGNVATRARGEGEAAGVEARKLIEEPAYGNIAELGLGVLSDYGLEPTGEILLDEKLGLHVAFGRSDHFGGQVGAAQFSSPDRVVHIDRVYIPSLQPRIQVVRVDLEDPDGTVVPLMRDGAYVIQW